MLSNNKFRCKKINDGIIQKKPRIIVIGDLHADYKKTIKIFKKLKIINYKYEWIAIPKNTVIVQMGDQLDGGGRGENESSGELELINFMENLHVQAEKYGGGVYSLIGNHEIMNLMGDFTYSSKKDIENQNGIKERKILFSPGSDLFNRLSCTRNVILKVGSFLFAHAGVLPEHINEKEKHLFIKKTNKLMRLFLQGKKLHSDEEIFRYFLTKSGIIWNRNYGDDKPSCNDVEKVTKLLNVGSMIVGHSIQENINSKCDNKLWRVDVGISDAFGKNNIEVLEILDDGVPLKKNKFKPMRILKV